jgi:predicted DNA-binding WGR domain protein
MMITVMIQNNFQLHLVRVDPERNMARFYAITLERSLFGDVTINRRWGRVGTKGRNRLDRFVSEQEALNHFLLVLRKKRARGYHPKNGWSAPRFTGQVG